MSLARVIRLTDPLLCTFHPPALAHPSTVCSLEGGLQNQCVRIPFAFERRSP